MNGKRNETGNVFLTPTVPYSVLLLYVVYISLAYTFNFFPHPLLNQHAQLSGFPLHFSYANILHIVGAVERTRLHLTENRRAEFGLSVYVHPYPNDVVSVWVFLVTMIPK